MLGKRGAARGLTVCLASVVVLTCTGESGCGGSCQPTSTDARDASSIDLSSPGNSSVLTARLAGGGNGLSGETLDFSISGDNVTRDLGNVTTGGDGVAQMDL